MLAGSHAANAALKGRYQQQRPLRGSISALMNEAGSPQGHGATIADGGGQNTADAV